MAESLLQFHEKTLREFREYLKKEFGVTDACEYLELVGGLPDEAPDSIDDKDVYEYKRRQVIEHAQKLDVRAHFRCFPPQNQDIAFVLKESATESNPDYYHRAQGRLHHEADSIEAITRLSATYLPTYLNSLQYGETIIQAIRAASRGLDAEQPFSEYIHLEAAEDFENAPVAQPKEQVPIDTGFFDDFYFTNVNKCPLPANRDHSELVEHNKDVLVDELDRLDPSLILCCAGSAWKAMLNSSTPVTPITRDDTIERYGHDEPTAINEIWEWGDATVLTLGHPNMPFWGGPRDEIITQAVNHSKI